MEIANLESKVLKRMANLDVQLVITKHESLRFSKITSSFSINFIRYEIKRFRKYHRTIF